MKSKFIFAFLCSVFCLVGLADKIDTDGVRIGYVNIRKIMVRAPQIKQIQEGLSKEFEADRQAIIALRNDIANENNEYDELSAKEVSEQVKSMLQKKLDEKQLVLAKKQQLMQDAFNSRRNESLAKLQTLVVNTVARVSKEHQLDLVVNNTGVVYVNSSIDITPQVLNYLKEKRID